MPEYLARTYTLESPTYAKLALHGQPTSPFDVYNDLQSRSSPKKNKIVAHAWLVMREKIIKHDEAMVQDWREDMDTLLVFAGLFSAVLTAFAVESYTTLLPPSNSDSTGGGFLTPSSAVLVNAMWFSSLILSLVSASVAILIKQWLHSYMTWTKRSSLESMELRQFCFRGLCSWRVPGLIALVPLVLQLALILFLVGLLVLLWSLNSTVARIGTAAVAALLFLAGFSTIMPAVCVHCPYRAWDLHVVLFSLWNACRNPHDTIHHLSKHFTAHITFLRILISIFQKLMRFATPAPSQETEGIADWTHRQIDAIITQRTALQCDLLAWADNTFMDDDLLAQIIRPILLSVDPSNASEAAHRFTLRPALLPVHLDLVQACTDGDASEENVQRMIILVNRNLNQESQAAKRRTILTGDDPMADSALAKHIYVTLSACVSRSRLQDNALEALAAAIDLMSSCPIPLFDSLDVSPLIIYSRDILGRRNNPTSNITKFCRSVSYMLGLTEATRADNTEAPYLQLRRLLNEDLEAIIKEAGRDPMHLRSFPYLCSNLYDWHVGKNLIDGLLVTTLVEAWDEGTEFWAHGESQAYRFQLESVRRLARDFGAGVNLPDTLEVWEKLHRPRISDHKEQAYGTAISDATSGTFRSAVRRSARRVVKQSYLCAV